MSQYDKQDQLPVAYPPANDARYVMAPPPMGYPTKDDAGYQGQQVPVETRTKDGFLRGCLAGLCCCWCLDICF